MPWTSPTALASSRLLWCPRTHKLRTAKTRRVGFEAFCAKLLAHTMARTACSEHVWAFAATLSAAARAVTLHDVALRPAAPRKSSAM